MVPCKKPYCSGYLVEVPGEWNKWKCNKWKCNKWKCNKCGTRHHTDFDKPPVGVG